MLMLGSEVSAYAISEKALFLFKNGLKIKKNSLIVRFSSTVGFMSSSRYKQMSLIMRGVIMRFHCIFLQNGVSKLQNFKTTEFYRLLVLHLSYYSINVISRPCLTHTTPQITCTCSHNLVELSLSFYHTTFIPCSPMP